MGHREASVDNHFLTVSGKRNSTTNLSWRINELKYSHIDFSYPEEDLYM
jgi:hypothetical protein